MLNAIQGGRSSPPFALAVEELFRTQQAAVQ